MNGKTIGITSFGAYIPYYYVERDVIGKAWGDGKRFTK